MMTKKTLLKSLLHVAGLALFAAANLVAAGLLAHEEPVTAVAASSYVDASDAEVEALFAEARARGLVVECNGADTASGCRR